MSALQTGTYDEALERLHRTGPEFDGWLSNHGPMVVESLARRGRSEVVHRWTDAYSRRLEGMPLPTRGITTADWGEALGDPARLGDWIELFRAEVRESHWTDVLVRWWPRLLPGIAAGATHGVIRTGHAVQALRDVDDPVRRAELAHALGYWAGRSQPVPSIRLTGEAAPDDLVTGVPRVPEQRDGIRDRLAQLAGTSGWAEHVARLAPATDDGAGAALDRLVDAVVLAYPRIAHGQPTMLVHAATAPNAVARVLPSLPVTMHAEAYRFAWTATAAVLAAYLPRDLSPEGPGERDADDAWQVAVDNGGEHVVKLADTALDVHARTGDPAALAAITTAVALDA